MDHHNQESASDLDASNMESTGALPASATSRHGCSAPPPIDRSTAIPPPHGETGENHIATSSRNPIPHRPGSADYDVVVRRIEERNMAIVERAHPHFGGLPICPFARAARLKKTIKYVVHPFDLDDDFGVDSFIVREMDRWQAEPNWEMLWFIDPDTTMPYEPYLTFYTRFAAYVTTRACHGFAGHPDHPFEIAGMRLQNEDYPNLQVISDEVLQEKRRKLRGTRYYDLLTPEELDLMGGHSLSRLRKTITDVVASRTDLPADPSHGRLPLIP